MGNDSKTGSHVQRPVGHRFGMVDTAIVRDPTLPRNVKTLYTYLATFCGETRSAFPGRTRMAEETGLSVSAVDEAKRVGSEVGLWTIEHRYDGERRTYSSNVYLLHDQGGSYVPGSGPGARTKGKPRGTSCGGGPKFGGGVAQRLGEGGPKSGPYQDHGSRPPSDNTRSTSGDTSGAAPRTSSPRDEDDVNVIEICPPSAFFDQGKWSDGRAQKWLVAASVAAMEKAGRTLPTGVRDEMGGQIKASFETATRQDVLTMLTNSLRRAHGGDPKLAWLFDPARVRPPRLSVKDVLAGLHAGEDPEDALIEHLDEEVGDFGTHATVYSMSERYHPNAIANTVRARAR